MILGEAIKEYRKEHGISQQAFADACGLSKPYISQLENNRNPRTGEPPIPSADTFIKVAKAMHVSLQELLKSVDQNQPISIRAISDADQTDPAINHDGYYLDPAAAELAQEIFEDPDLRVLLDAKRDLSADDLNVVIDMIKALKAKENKFEDD